MNKTHLETFRGLINQFDLDLNYNMKLSSLDKVLEDSMSFLSSLYEKKINIDIDTGSLLHHSKIEVESFQIDKRTCRSYRSIFSGFKST